MESYGISTKARAATYQWLMPRALPAAGVFAQTELNRFTGSCSAGTVPTQRRPMPANHDGRRWVKHVTCNAPGLMILTDPDFCNELEDPEAAILGTSNQLLQLAALGEVQRFFGRWHLGHRVWSRHCAAKTFRVVRHGTDTSPGKQENRIKPMVHTADSWMTKLCPFAGCASASCEGKPWKIWQKGRAAWQLDPKAEFWIPDWHTLVGSFGGHDKVKDYHRYP